MLVGEQQLGPKLLFSVSEELFAVNENPLQAGEDLIAAAAERRGLIAGGVVEHSGVFFVPFASRRPGARSLILVFVRRTCLWDQWHVGLIWAREDLYFCGAKTRPPRPRLLLSLSENCQFCQSETPIVTYFSRKIYRNPHPNRSTKAESLGSRAVAGAARSAGGGTTPDIDGQDEDPPAQPLALRRREIPYFALHRTNLIPLFHGVSEIFLTPRKIPVRNLSCEGTFTLFFAS